MLVLSRRVHEKVVFPGLNIAVQVLSVKAGNVRLGIEAPRAVTVLREEIQDRAAVPSMSAGPSTERVTLRNVNILLRNRLKVAEIGLALLERQLQGGMLSDGQNTLEKIREDLDLLRRRLDVEVKDAGTTGLPGQSNATTVQVVNDDQKLTTKVLHRNVAQEFEGAFCGV